jgi:putative endonuclease
MAATRAKGNHFVYLIECQNGSFYAGYTTNPERRYQEHLCGTSKSKYTRSFPPKNLVGCWQVLSGKGDALRIEKGIKRLSRAEKMDLAKDPDLLLKHFDMPEVLLCHSIPNQIPVSND